MQAFGHFSSNKMKFYGLNGIMGHLCLHKNDRGVPKYNKKSARSNAG
jgi:hypothetical protein